MRNGYAITRLRCCGSASIRSWPAMRMPNDADRLRPEPNLQIVADQKLGEALGSQPTLSRLENAPSARDLVLLNDALLDQFIRLCGKQIRQRGEILLDIDSTDDPTHVSSNSAFFNCAYDQLMYHPMLIFERHTGSCWPYVATSQCLQSCPYRSHAAAPGAATGSLFSRRARSSCEAMPVSLCHCSTSSASFSASSMHWALLPTRSFSAALAAAETSAPLLSPHRNPAAQLLHFSPSCRPLSRQRRICYKAEHTASGTNLRFLITHCPAALARSSPFTMIAANAKTPGITGSSRPPALSGSIWSYASSRRLLTSCFRRGTFRSVGELMRAILDYIRRRNHSPQPFLWTTSARSIARKVRHCNEALETGH